MAAREGVEAAHGAPASISGQGPFEESAMDGGFCSS